MENSKKIYLITATYNRKERLINLYDSLLRQTDFNFIWFIIDDGSIDGTEKIVKNIFTTNLFEVRYIKKKNEGKSRSLNKAFAQIENDDTFALVVDDDEELYSNAIEIVNKKMNKYNGLVGYIYFMRDYNNGIKMLNKEFFNDMKTNWLAIKSNGYIFDGYIGYFTYAIKKYKFPIFEGEKYIGPSVLSMLVDLEYENVFCNIAIGKTDYYEDGITRSGRRLRIKNPKSMLIYCILNQDKKNKLYFRIKRSIQGYAYFYFSKMTLSELNRMEKEYKNNLNRYTKILGFILYLLWSKKYDDKKNV